MVEDDLIKWISRIRKKDFGFLLVALGSALVVLPVVTPEKEVLIGIVRAGRGYFSAVSLSEFMGIRYGIIISFGVLLIGLGVFLVRSAGK